MPSRETTTWISISRSASASRSRAARWQWSTTAGAAAGRASRLRRWFTDADVVVFGHSHLPWYEVDVRDGHRQHHVNPGSAMQRRRAPTCTVAHVLIAGGTVAAVRHVPVGPSGAVPFHRPV